ncbi:MAG: glycosyltransferase family 4 protein [Chloroflexales bacterium]
MSLTIHMITAALAPGDAIGNYILALSRLLRAWGCNVYLYSDHPNPRYPLEHRHSSAYRPDGGGILWLHYSIYSDSVRWVGESQDYTILDFHGICPPQFFHGYNAEMEHLCARGIELLPALAEHTDLAIGHTDYIVAVLRGTGYRFIRKLPLVVDTGRFTGAGDPVWEPLLSQIEYLCFVGRVVPQKNLALAIQVFAALRRHRPGTKLFLVGGRHLESYAAELEDLAARLDVAEDVIFTGPIIEPDALTSFLRHARFYLCLSEWESFCVPIIESLHFGVPVLGHQVLPIPETMGPGGVLLSGDAEDMAAQINAVWADQPRYESLQRAGRSHAERFTDVALRAELLALLRELAQGM